MCSIDHFAAHERHDHRLRHSPGDYSLALLAGCGRLFSTSRFRDARPASRALSF
jgi:hypothetical protein